MINPRTTAALFPGQGSQIVGMGRDFAENFEIARQTFEQADDILGYALSRICRHGPENELDQTVNTQPALYVCSVAIWRALRQQWPEFMPAWTAGHSLGEFTALTVAGALTFEDGLRLVHSRGSLMQRAGEENPGAMAALLALDMPTVEALCIAVSHESSNTVVVANDNCPGQIVVSGNDAAVEELIVMAQEAGARRAVKLAVSVAAHSPLMASASAAFSQAIQNTPFLAPETKVIGNVSADSLETATDIREELNLQLTQTVRWTRSMQSIIVEGAESFVEIGAGSVLTGLMRRIDRSKKRINLDSVEALQALWVSQSG